MASQGVWLWDWACLHCAQLRPEPVPVPSAGAVPCRRAAAVLTCLFCAKGRTQPLHVYLEAVPCRRAAASGAATPRGTSEPNRGASRCTARERSASASPPEAEARDTDAADAEAAGVSSDNVKVPPWLRPGPSAVLPYVMSAEAGRKACIVMYTHSPAEASWVVLILWCALDQVVIRIRPPRPEEEAAGTHTPRVAHAHEQ